MSPSNTDPRSPEQTPEPAEQDEIERTGLARYTNAGLVREAEGYISRPERASDTPIWALALIQTLASRINVSRATPTSPAPAPEPPKPAEPLWGPGLPIDRDDLEAWATWSDEDDEPDCGYPAIVSALAKQLLASSLHGGDTEPDGPWPLREVVRTLVDYSRHVLTAHDCDAQGHEVYRDAVKAGERWLAAPVVPPSTEPANGE